MPDERGVGEVRPIYRRGDRVLVKFMTGFCALVIQEYEYRGGELWFYGVSCCSMMYFPSASIVGRLDAGEVLSWSELS
ncbi:MAG TPA: hypothetical protein VGX48_18785 [Pyrinomonadaceae bacterium]|jgi:hypothetical protein|nr:hypothetical protein [Pyrinomonadaceae bacterium]